MLDLVERHAPEAMAVGNGTWGREAEQFARAALKRAGVKIPVVSVSESGASIYSASDLAREELPDLDVTVRGAVSIGRRFQDPVAELVKIDPKSIGGRPVPARRGSGLALEKTARPGGKLREPSRGRARYGELSAARRLRERRFDLVIDFRGDLRHLILGRWVGRRLYGYGIRGGGFLLTEELAPDEAAHESERYVNLVRLAGAETTGGVGPLRMELSDGDRAEARRLLDSLEFDLDRLVVALCPLSRSPTRWWRPERFAALSRHLHETYGAQVLVFGDPASAGFVSEMLREPLEGVHNLVGRTTLKSFAAALERVDLVVSIESSPIHFASALGKPIVTLFGGTTLPKHWAPHRVIHRIVTRPVPCAPCFRISCPLERVECMEAIEVDHVIEATRDILSELADKRPEIRRKLPPAALLAAD